MRDKKLLGFDIIVSEDAPRDKVIVAQIPKPRLTLEGDQITLTARRGKLLAVFDAPPSSTPDQT